MLDDPRALLAFAVERLFPLPAKAPLLEREVEPLETFWLPI